MQPVVVLELNEVPWRVADWWVDRRPDAAIARLLDRSSQWTTVTPDEGHLSPWVTWPTLHRGVPNTVHGIGHFGQDTADADRHAPPWWVTATEAGLRVGLFGLLHTGTLPDDVDRYAFFVPDTFAADPTTHPPELESFQAFNLSMARASARNVSTSVDTRAAARFLARAPRLGLRPATVARLAKQLVDERRRPETRVRRRSFQSVLAFDLFERQLRRTSPDAAAFFTNHVASAMHRYWAATFPADYPPERFGFDDAWIARWSGELDEALGHADRMVDRLVAHAERTGALLVVTSSMGQQAAQGTPVNRQLYLRDIARLARAGSVDPAAVERRPAMDPHVNVRVDAPAELERFRTLLGSLTVGGRPIVWHEEGGGFVSLEFGQADDAIGEIRVGGVVHAPAELGFEVVEIEDEVASTGYHIPEGLLAVFDPTGRRALDQARTEVASTAVAPLLLETLGVAAPRHHQEPAVGR